MSLNIVKSDGSLETVAGLVDDTQLKSRISAVETDISSVQEVIPSDASASNPLIASNLPTPYTLNGTVRNTILEALAGINDYENYVQKGSSSADNVDLNDFLITAKTTKYFCYNPINRPVTGWIWVETTGFRDSGYGIQIVRTLSENPQIYLRGYYLVSGTSVWGSWQKLITESDLAIKKKDIAATSGATSFSTTIPLSMAQRNKPFYLEVLSVGNSNAIKEMKYRVFVSSINTNVTTQEISKDSNFTNVSITFDESTGYALSFSSTETLYSTTVYIQQ